MNLLQTLFGFLTMLILSEASGRFDPYSYNIEYGIPSYDISHYFDSTLRVHPHPVSSSSSRHIPIEDQFTFEDVQEHRRPPFRSANLFTPNTIQQPAETKGQIDQYNMDLVERANELEMERNGSTTTSSNNGNSEDVTDSRHIANNGHYVNVNNNGFKYNYYT